MPCELWLFGRYGPAYSDNFVTAFPYVPGSPVVTFNGTPLAGGDYDETDPTTGQLTIIASWDNTNALVVTICYDLTTTPVPGAWLDFDLDGFAGSDNITSDVIGFRWNRGGTPDLVGGVQPGQATLVLRNTDGKYNPDNSGGPFYGKLLPGRPFWFGINDDGTLGPGFTPVSDLLLETGDRLLLETGDALLTE